MRHQEARRTFGLPAFFYAGFFGIISLHLSRGVRDNFSHPFSTSLLASGKKSDGDD